MSLGACLDAVKAQVASGFSAWPVRWPNETFEGIATDADGNPLDASGNKIAFVEGDLIGGKNEMRSFGLVGSRTMIHPATIRFYLCVPSGQGQADAYTQADALGSLFELKGLADTGASITRTHAPSVNAGVAGFADGSFWVLMVDIPAEFTYLA